MHLWHNIQYPLFAPEAPAAPAGELSKDDILDFLNKDDEPVEDEVIPVKEEKKEIPDEKKKAAKDEEEDTEDDKEKDEDDEEDEDDELALLEDELEEPDEEKLELTTPTSRREILKKYPNIFKDFPSLEKSYYREMEFTKIVPTIQDAKEAVEKAETLDKFEKDLSSGNIETILKAVQTNNPQAFNKVADDYLMTLAKVDAKAYHHVLGNTIKHVIEHMISEGRSSENEALQSAAVILNQFVFGSSKFTRPTKLAGDEESKPEIDDKEAKIAEREKAFVKQRYTATNTELNNKVSKAFKTTIDAYIDPKKSMPDYVRKHASREALEELESLINKDTRFRTIVDKLWERAFQDDFSSESVDKIYGAFKSKAGTLIGSVVKKARNEALKGLNKRSSDDDSRPGNESKNGDESRRRNDSKKGDESHRRNDSSKKVPSGMSSLEYLMSDD